MTICDKIQTVGETLESNLNARGVSCTFGTGTGEKNILQMTNLITSSNLKGSADSIISISASRPYLLSGEKTDLIVTLHNGVGTPLANKSVTITDGTSVYNGITNSNGIFVLYDLTITDTTTFTVTYNSTITDTCTVYSCLLVDYATTNKHTDVWNNMNWFTRADDGTSVYYQNTGSSNLYRNTDYLSINGEDVAIDFELINSTYCRVQLERKDSGSQYLACNYHNTSGKVHIEIKTTGTYFYLDNTLVSSNTTQLNQSTFRLYFLTQGNNTTNFKYKDFRIYYL